MALPFWRKLWAPLVLLPASLAAEPSVDADAHEIDAHAETHAELFRRAMLPGPGGAIVETETVLPVYQFVRLGAHAVDSPLGEDTLDVQLSGWGLVQAAEPDQLGRYDGDLQIANVGVESAELAGFQLRLGRQQVSGGAARFVRFDGAQAGVSLGPGLVLSAYGGWVVLPRWNRTPGYYHLGAAADSLLDNPLASEELQRGHYWLAGGKLGFRATHFRGSLSVHEQRDAGAVGRRNLGLDVSGEPLPALGLGSALLLELDSLEMANLRAWGDLALADSVDLSAEYLRAEPALLLSRQAVLSVFSTDAYHEAGGSLTWRALPRVSLEGGSFVQVYEDGGPGARMHGGIRFRDGMLRPTLVLLSYSRVITPDNGYHSVRTALRRSIHDDLSATLELYGYFYDESISGYRSSSVYATTLEYQAYDSLSILWGGSLARSPYAELDASTLLRLSYQFYAPNPRSRW